MPSNVLSFFLFVMILVMVFVVFPRIKWAREKLRDRAASRRAGAVKEVADTLGLQFQADGDPGCIEQEYARGEFFLFEGRHPRWVAQNTIYGQIADIQLICFEHRYYGQFRRNSEGGGTTWRWTAPSTEICMWSEGLDTPAFSLGPEDSGDKMGDAVSGFFGRMTGKSAGNPDIDFESHPRFSTSFRLLGDDEKRIRTLFTRKVLSAFEEQIPGDGNVRISVVARNGLIKLYPNTSKLVFESNFIQPDELLSFIRTALRLAEYLKEAAES